MLDPDPKERARKTRASNLAKSYRSGWTDGAARKSMQDLFTKHNNHEIKTEYERGYTDGYNARRDALNAANARLGYEPSIIRLTKGQSTATQRSWSTALERPEGWQPVCRAVKDGEQCEGLDGHAAKHWATIIGAWEPDETDSYDGPIFWRDH